MLDGDSVRGDWEGDKFDRRRMKSCVFILFCFKFQTDNLIIDTSLTRTKSSFHALPSILTVKIDEEDHNRTRHLNLGSD